MSKYFNPKQFIDPKRPMLFVIGGRGTGKTFSTMLMILQHAIDTEKPSIYLRRYKNEIDMVKINTAKLSEYLTGLNEDNRIIQATNDGMTGLWLVREQGESVTFERLLVLMQALSIAGKVKSNDFTDVEYIVYDEFIDPRGAALKNEVLTYFNFAMTVFRDFSQFKAIFLANATDLYNDYFLDLEILPTGKISKFKDIKVVIYDTSAELLEEQTNSALGRLVSKIDVDGNALNNTFSKKFDDLIGKLDNTFKNWANIQVGTNTFGVWISTEKQQMLIANKFDPQKVKYAVDIEDITSNVSAMPDDMYFKMYSNFLNGLLRFTDAKTRTRIIKIFKSSPLLNRRNF